MRMRVGVLVFILLSSSAALAQNTKVVEAQVVTATDATHPGLTLKVALLAHVAAGYHINDHKPSLDYLIPTDLKLNPSDQFAVKNVVYPKGTLKKFPFADVPLSVYEGTVMVGALLQAGKTVPAGTYGLKARFAYQACNDHACLAPTSVPVTITIKVVPQNVPLKRLKSDVFQRIRFE
jgi:hypothetical protein